MKHLLFIQSRKSILEFGFYKGLMAFAFTAMFTGSTHAFDTGDGEFLNRLYWRDFEEIRKIENGQFISGKRNIEFGGSHNLIVANPGVVTQISADITVLEVINKNASPEARVGGFFLNDGSGITGSEGEIFARAGLTQLNLLDQTELVGEVHVFQCTDELCDNGNELFLDNASFGTFNINDTVNASISFDGAQFLTFDINGTVVSFDVLSAGLTVNPSIEPFAGITTADFEIDDRMDDSYIKAAFDNVMYNGAMHDDFSSAQLDPAKWNGRRLEGARKKENG